VTEQAARAEVTHDALAVGRGRRGGGTAFGLVELLDFFGAGVRTPRFFAVSAVVGDRVQFTVVECGDHDLVSDDDWRRESARHSDFPSHILARAELHGWLLIIGRDAGAAWPAKLRPSQR